MKRELTRGCSNAVRRRTAARTAAQKVADMFGSAGDECEPSPQR